MDRHTMRHDHPLEWQLEHRAQCREHSCFMPWCRPDAKLPGHSTGRGEGVGEYDGTLLRKPERGLAAIASVVEREKASGQLAPWIDPLELRLGNVPAEEQAWTKSGDVVTLHEDVDVAHVVGFENDRRRRRTD